ncbi:anti-phage ZorAB system protein ZorA [Cellulomonas wangsupingiae]|uniref:anti-phage ZorAB system protein ZorA n=1 Tax=Cellulomonas wangsupingiae TaxID=2968085 RepID=UPI001D0DC7B5|nr:anti-phage ZorAB system protein ZorA [Cellulomonas wangsupingiae]MCM0639529.1 anti-phage defense ZorAB system protein ZorA [Cellulomonas wangsupingiae]
MDNAGQGGFLNLVFPEWGAMLNGNVEAVTPWLVLVIWALAGWVCYFAWREARRALDLLEESARPIRGVTQEHLWERRAEIAAAADDCSELVANAWREFNETLVSDGRQLFNTVEAAEFFDEHRFAPTLVGNRLLHAAPTALTMLGLLGTFIGLTVGLRDLDLGSTAEELRVGIQGLVHGAALGFTASLWGVATSLVTNVFERWQERRVVKRAHALQAEIDHLFKMRSPEQSLSDIAASSNESKAALQTLHEKIGSALQESVKGVGEKTTLAVTAAIHDSLGPIMADLAERAANQSADVFKEISRQLTTSFSDVGTSLAAELSASSQAMRSTIDHMSDQLKLQADEHTAQMAELRTTAGEGLARQAAEHSSNMNEFRQVVAEQLAREQSVHASQMSELRRAMAEQAKQHVELVTELQRTATEQLERNAAAYAEHVSELQRMTGELIAAMTEATSHQAGMLTRSLPQVVSSLERASSLISSAMIGMNSASETVEGVTAHLGRVSTDLGDMLTSAITSMTELSSKTAGVAQAMDAQQGTVVELTERSVAAAQHLSRASETLNGGFAGMRSAQQLFLSDLEQQLKKHSAAMAGWLAAYGNEVTKQTSDRMEQWNAQTDRFSSSMLSTVQVLSEVVDELSAKRPTAEEAVA